LFSYLPFFAAHLTPLSAYLDFSLGLRSHPGGSVFTKAVAARDLIGSIVTKGFPVTLLYCFTPLTLCCYIGTFLFCMFPLFLSSSPRFMTHVSLPPSDGRAPGIYHG
jgi:hypothetical protein